LEQVFSGTDKIDIFLGRYFGIAAWNSGGEKCFRSVRFDPCHSAPIDQVLWIRVGCNNFLGRPRFPRDLRNQLAR